MSLSAPWIDYDPRQVGLAGSTFSVVYMLDRANSNRKRGFVKLTSADTGWYEIQPLPFLTMTAFAGALDYDPVITGKSGAVGDTWLGPGLGLACYYEKAGTDDFEWARISEYAGGAPAVADSGGTFHLTDQGWALDTGGGGGLTVNEASIAFTDGDTARRVTVTNASLGPTSKVLLCVRRPNVTEADDNGYVYTANVVTRAAGSMDVLIVCTDPEGGFPEPPPNETVVLEYAF